MIKPNALIAPLHQLFVRIVYSPSTLVHASTRMFMSSTTGHSFSQRRPAKRGAPKEQSRTCRLSEDKLIKPKDTRAIEATLLQLSNAPSAAHESAGCFDLESRDSREGRCDTRVPAYFRSKYFHLNGCLTETPPKPEAPHTFSNSPRLSSTYASWP